MGFPTGKLQQGGLPADGVATILLQVFRDITARHYGEAERRLHALLVDHPDCADALYLLAVMEQGRGEDKGAADHFWLACCLDTRVDFFHRHLGQAYGVKQWVKQVSLYLTDLALRPACPAPYSQPRPLSQVALCAVDCLYYDLTLIALKNCLAHCPVEEVHFFSDRTFHLPTMRCHTIDPIKSITAYSQFMVKGLADVFSTSHVLFVQWDGFIVDGRYWRPEFMNYDYIGAKWWYEDGLTVGNGGFSLRSRKLLRALQDNRIVPSHPEDVCICRTHRGYLEKRHGIRLASPLVADDFAFERAAGGQPTFGFHGLFNFSRLRLVEPSFAEYFLLSLPDSTLQGVEAHELIFHYLERLPRETMIRILKTLLKRIPANPGHEVYVKMLNYVQKRGGGELLDLMGGRGGEGENDYIRFASS
ncbi:MAG: tetratricopeptide repeat protein [Magnetococcales bacterium]|nr:tetratricopeptide repeat protein [Magnetococcales bacterium]